MEKEVNINVDYADCSIKYVVIIMINELAHDEIEIVAFVNDEARLDVNVSPSEDTVWLSLTDMCLLFGRDKSVISRHIKNVILENNLDVNQVVAKNATTGNDGKTYVVSFYNLDVIIPLGHKVHSQNGIIFRKWANSVLKEYLLKGYVINENRTLITNENYVNLINKVDSMDKRLSAIEKTNLEKEKVFFDREMFDAKSFISDIISNANTSISSQASSRPQRNPISTAQQR